MAKPPRNTLDVRSIERSRIKSGKRLDALSSIFFKLAKHQKIVFASLLLFAATVIGIYIWDVINHSTTSGVEQLKSVETKVSKHYLLPGNETPALATVTDTSKLTTSFFKGVKNGDQVLIYQNNHIAIVYRPSIDRVVSVGPVSIDAPPPGASSQNNIQSVTGP